MEVSRHEQSASRSSLADFVEQGAFLGDSEESSAVDSMGGVLAGFSVVQGGPRDAILLKASEQ